MAVGDGERSDADGSDGEKPPAPAAPAAPVVPAIQTCHHPPCKGLQRLSLDLTEGSLSLLPYASLALRL